MNGKENLNFTDKATEEAGMPDTLFKDIIASGPDIHVVLNRKSLGIIFASPLFYKHFKYTPEDISHKNFPFLNLFDKIQSVRLRTHVQNIAEGIDLKGKYVYYKVHDKENNIKPVYIYIAALANQNTNNELLHLLIIPDNTRYIFPFISSDTRNLFLEQFENEGFGTFEWMVQTDNVYWSDGMYDIYELDKNKQDLNLNFFKQYVHPDDVDKTNDAIKQLLEGENIEMEYRIITEKKNVKVILSLCKMIPDAHNKPMKLVGSIRDISAHRSIEENLKKNVDELNRSNKELEEFAYVASHDLQEPLRKISTFSDRLSEKYAGALTNDGTMYLQRIIASAENMRLLINNLLEFSRITKSTQPFTSVNLNFILHQVKTELELTIEETGTIIQSDNLPAIVASATQMKQLFSNLIGNSIKFRKPYVRPIISIETSILNNKEKIARNLSQNVVYHKIKLTDNGIGFENEYASRIFQVFQRLHGKSEYPGSGIGLAICKKIAEHHHGQIFAENIPGCGALFTVILPEQQSLL
jgi:nitrogen-specific signal transduction histidine kinase